MMYTMLVYDRHQAEVLERAEFDSKSEALAARFEAEDRLQYNSEHIEIVVLGARTRDDLMRTHSRYFLTLRQLLNEVGEMPEAV
jgi:hypothetical protein